MPVTPPDRDQLKHAAEFHNLHLSDAELEQMSAVLADMAGLLSSLEERPVAAPPLKYPRREVLPSPGRHEDRLNAILCRCKVQGAASGPLAGKRIALKDSILLSGIPLCCGSRVLEGYLPDRDATIVTRMLDAGAEIVAKTNMDDLALSATGDTSAFGPVLNPHSREHLAGGSSGGSAAALSYDGIDLALGGDQGGSIRVPASWCGVVGLKPTHGLVPYTDIIGLDNTIDHIGPMGRSAADVALLLEVIAGKDPLDPRQGEVPVRQYRSELDLGLQGLRIGIVREGFGFAHSNPQVDAAARRALDAMAKLGATVREVSVPLHRELQGLLRAIVPEGLLATALSGGTGYHHKGGYNSHFAAFFGKRLVERADLMPPFVKLNLLLGTCLTRGYRGQLYTKGQLLRESLRADYDRVLGDADILAMPTTPVTALPLDPNRSGLQLPGRGWLATTNTAPLDLTGHPALSIPCAKLEDLPVGLMLIGRQFEEATLLRAAHGFEQKIDWRSPL